MKYTKFLVMLTVLMAITAHAQEVDWDLRRVSIDAAKEAEGLRKQGGDVAVIKAIESCYASTAGNPVWGVRSARCFVLDLTGSTLAYKEAKDAGKEEYNPFFKSNGGVFTRSALPLGTLSQIEAANVFKVVQEGIYEALPYLKKK